MVRQSPERQGLRGGIATEYAVIQAQFREPPTAQENGKACRKSSCVSASVSDYGVSLGMINCRSPMESLPSSLSQCDPIFLLWCDEPHGKISIDEVSKALVQSANPEGDICALLGEANWRCHLVAAVALVISDYRTKPKLVEALWGTLDAGSWVSPQLAVCLASIDPDFSSQAKARIESGCPVLVRPLVNFGEVSVRRHIEQVRPGLIGRFAKEIAALLKFQMKPLPSLGEEGAMRHVAQGPDGPIERSAKTLAALLHLCSLRRECEPWLPYCRANRSTQGLLALDLHHGDQIAEAWRTKFSSALSAFRSS